jgi:uncharacterized Zn-binding protein involved in type VI secretion
MPAVARQGDQGVPHCSPFSIASGSGSVFVDGMPAATVGSASTAHQLPGGRACGTHNSSIAGGSGTVFVNGKPIARVGDPFGGCTSVSQGSGTVFAG